MEERERREVQANNDEDKKKEISMDFSRFFYLSKNVFFSIFCSFATVKKMLLEQPNDANQVVRMYKIPTKKRGMKRTKNVSK